MRTLWNVVSFLAVVHLLALAMFGGWLWRTHRLDAGRLREVRSILATTVEQQQDRERLAGEEATRLDQQQQDDARRRNPPLPSVEKVNAQHRFQEAQQRAVRQVDDTRQQLTAQLELVQQQVREERSVLAAERQKLTVNAAASQQHQEEQMAKAVGLLESLPSRQARQKIVELVGSGRMDQAVAYLNAMNQRLAGKVLAEFKTDQENKLATELLERIRKLDLSKAGPGPDASNAQPASFAAGKP